MTDRELILSYQQTPSSEVFGELVRRHTNLVYAHARRLVKAGHLAEDIAQEVFLTLFRELPTLDPHVPLVGWLFLTTRHRSLEALRAAARRQNHEREAAMSQDAADTTEPVWKLIAGDVDHAVAELSAEERHAILLRYFAGKTHQEIAGELAISEAAAKKRVQRAVESLRTRLTAHGMVLPAAALAEALAAHAATEAAPAALASTITSAVAASAPAVSAGLKGAAVFMGMSKFYAVAAVAVLVAVPLTLVTIYNSSSAPVPATSPVAAAPAPDDITIYDLPPDTAVKIVVGASPALRDKMYRRVQAGEPAGAIKAPAAFLFEWKDGNPVNLLVFATNEVPLAMAAPGLAASVLGLNLEQVELAPSVPKMVVQIPGDIVYSPKVEQGKALRQLEELSEKHLHVPLKLEFRDSPQGRRLVIDIADSAKYTLAAVQALKRVDAPDPIREEFYKKLIQMGPGMTLNRMPMAALAGMNNGSLQRWTWEFDRPFTLKQVLEYFLDAYSSEVEGGIQLPVTGDFIGREGSSLEERRAALQEILRRELKKEVTLTYREVQRKVLVLHGKWNYTPAESPRAADNSPTPSIEIYRNGIESQPRQMSVGDKRRLAGSLGNILKQQVILEGENLPDQFTWVLNDLMEAGPEDRDVVLKHIQEQTGLEWKEELRQVRRLFVEGVP